MAPIIDDTSKQEALARLLQDSSSPSPVKFTAHNIRLDDGSYTKSVGGIPTDTNGTIESAKRVLNLVFPGPKEGLRIADLGCLEGGYTVALARLGFQAVGIDVREVNIDACQYVKSKVNLPNLEFVRDDVWNIERYGMFDAIFCCGLFYHLDKPKAFLDLLSRATKRVLIMDTHVSQAGDSPSFIRPRRLRRALSKIFPLKQTGTTTHKLSSLTENEGLPGRWTSEFRNDRAFRDRGNRRWASWDNRRSFWIQREYLLEAMQRSGFDFVCEQYDGWAPDIAHTLTKGLVRIHGRGMFVGIKNA